METKAELSYSDRAGLEAVYSKIAQLLPVEGRDYALTIKVNGGVYCTVTGLTPFGKVFAEHCNKQLAQPQRDVKPVTSISIP